MLVDVKSCQPQGDLVLQLRREPLLDDVVAALDVEILEGHRVRPEQLVGVRGHEGDSEQAAEVVSARSGGDLEDFKFNLIWSWLLVRRPSGNINQIIYCQSWRN